MPRLTQVPRAEVGSPLIAEAYAEMFGDRDPVVEPGTASGTPGHWWTVFALEPDLFELMRARHHWQFSENRRVPVKLRELGIARAGWARGSQFVFSQHCKALRRAGATEDEIAAIPSWSDAACFDALDRAVLGYADDLVLGGGRTSDGRFDALRAGLDDVQILELTFMICTYDMSATMSKALRLEYDDRADPVVEIPVPAGAAP